MNQADFSAAEVLRLTAKAEPHCHFEGSVSPVLLQDLARNNGIDLFEKARAPIGEQFYRPHVMEQFLSGSVQFSEFADFIAVYLKITECLATSADIREAGEHFLDHCRANRIIAADLYFTPSSFTLFGRNVPLLFESLAAVKRQAYQLSSIQFNWIFDIVRNLSEDGMEIFSYFELAKDRGLHVKYLGLAGDELIRGAEHFEAAFRKGRALGLAPLAHSGESGTAADMLKTIELLQPLRIGHGIRALDDPYLAQLLRERQIPLEVSPWSNIKLGLASLTSHPIAAMIRAELNVIPAADDPGIFGSSLTDNYVFALEQGIPLDRLINIAARSITVVKTQ